GLTLGTVTQASSATVPAGNVISQNPAAGTSVAAGSAVALVVSSGLPFTFELSNSSVAENSPLGTVVGTFSTTAPSAIYTLVAGTGATDNDSFSIVGTQLQTNTPSTSRRRTVTRSACAPPTRAGSPSKSHSSSACIR